MDDETFNMSMRKFLKTVGVTSQQKIEQAIQAAIADGRLSDQDVDVSVTLKIDQLDLTHKVDGTIQLKAKT